ncbi:hypothetical protein ACFYE9_24940 [Rhizobium leguminosarum]|uniref:hypothetical protein n=1 Tax=Rhizobium leguminosarum TaxID=384 RepID=UPI0036D7F56E
MQREQYYDDKTYWDVWQAVHWLDDEGRALENDEVADRFNTKYLVRNPKGEQKFLTTTRSPNVDYRTFRSMMP